MAKTAWPTGSEVQSYLEGLGATLPDGITLTDEIDAVVREVEDRTRYKPFLKEGSDSVNYLDPPQGDSDLLDLKNGYGSITELAVGVTGAADGTALTVNSGFYLLPEGVDGADRPYDWVRFASAQSGNRRSIRITGKRGRTNIPVDLWRAVRNQIAGRILSGADGGQWGAQKIKQGPVEIDFGTAEYAGFLDRLCREFDAAVMRHTRA